MTAVNLFILIMAGVNLGIGFLVFFKKYKSPTHQSFLLFCLGSSLWTISYIFLAHSHMLIFDKLIILGSLLSTAGIFIFAKYFPIDSTHSFSRKDAYSLLPLIICGFLLFDNLIIKNVHFVNSYPAPVNGSLFPVFATVLFIYLGLSIYYLVRNFKRSNPIQQNRVSIFTFSLVVFVVASVLFDLILPAFGYYEMNSLGPVFLFLFVSSCAYTLLVKRLLDIRIILQNTFIYSVLLIVVSLLYYLLVLLIQKYITHVFDVSLNVQLISIVVVAIGVPYIDTRLRRISDRWLGGKRYTYSNELLHIIKEISSTIALEDTIEKVTQRIGSIMKTKDASIHIAHENTCVNDTEPVCGDNNMSVYIPIIFQKKHIATLSVKNKKSGEKINKYDIEFLQTVCVYLSSHLRTLRALEETQKYTHTLEGEVTDTKRVAEKLQEHQNNMIVDIAHNLQTPLTILRGEVQSLQHAQKRFTRRDLEKLDDSIDRFSQFVTRLLQAGNTEQQGAEMKLFNLSNVVQDICEYTKTVAESQSISFTYDLDEEVGFNGDEVGIRDMLVNILSNAMKYIKKEGSHNVYMSLYSKDDIVISISDNGIGISPEHIPHIFESWYQADPLKQGSGLGLSIVKQIVTQHSGTIFVSSNYGVETCFTITFPKQKTG